jgi:hypothetical protein
VNTTAIVNAILKLLGNKNVPSKPTLASVGTSAVKVRSGGNGAVRVTIFNDSQTQILYLGLSNTVTAANDVNKGWPVAANGGAISVPWDVDVWGIYPSGASANYVPVLEEA